MKNIKIKYERIVDEYLELFCKKHDVYIDFWVANKKGGIVLISDAFFDFEDIRLDIDLEVEKQLIWLWCYDNNRKKKISYSSYISGLRVKDLK